MSRKKRINLAAMAIAAAAMCIILAWRVYQVNRLETVHRVIQEAWDRGQPEDMPDYLQYLDMYSNFSIEKIEKGDPWVITVRVQGVDLAEQLRNTDPALFAGDTAEWKLDQYLTDLVIRADLVYVDCFVYLFPEEEGFRVRFTETFVDAMSGMTLTYAREMVEELVGGAQ